MADAVVPGCCYKALSPVEATVIHYFRAPYSGGEKVRLPAGLVFEVAEHIVEDAEAVYAVPVPYEDWEEGFAPFVKDTLRYDGYSLTLSKKDILERCEGARKTPVPPESLSRRNAIAGCIRGTAVGDALGLAFEGMSSRRIARMAGNRLRHRLLFGYGMLSDDTEHTCMAAQALIRSGGDPDTFRRQLARRMRWWLLALPAGIGLGTLRALVKLWLGFSPEKSGVRSAGNGPMMRSAVLGVFMGHDPERLQELVRINTRITHTDPRAERAAQIVARLAWCNATDHDVTPQTITRELQAWLDEDEELAGVVEQAAQSAAAGDRARDFCQRQHMKKGVSGYCYSTLKVVLQIWLRHPRGYEAGIDEAIRCGGDTDTVAAILSGIIGAGCGEESIPEDWKQRIRDWPRTRGWIDGVIRQLAWTDLTGLRRDTDALLLPFTLARNLAFMVLVLAHGFRRLLPPY